MGVGNGMFASPNSASIMSSVPREERGIASGMMSTMMNTAFSASMVIFFTIIIVGLTNAFPGAMANSLASVGRGPACAYAERNTADGRAVRGVPGL